MASVPPAEIVTPLTTCAAPVAPVDPVNPRSTLGEAVTALASTWVPFT